MKGVLGWVLAGILAASLIGGWLWHDQKASQWETDRARIQGQVGAEKAVADAATHRGDSLTRIANSVAVLGTVARRRSDSLSTLADSLATLEALLQAKLPATPPPACQLYADALAACQARGDALERSLHAVQTADSSHQLAFVKDSLALLEKSTSLTVVEQSRDSLQALVARAPGTCRIPLIGLRCPVVGAGYAWVADGTGRVVGGLAVGAMIPLVGGR